MVPPHDASKASYRPVEESMSISSDLSLLHITVSQSWDPKLPTPKICIPQSNHNRAVWYKAHVTDISTLSPWEKREVDFFSKLWYSTEMLFRRCVISSILFPLVKLK